MSMVSTTSSNRMKDSPSPGGDDASSESKLDRIIVKLTERIEANEWPEEVPLPSRMRLSDEYKVSPSTISNAINHLQKIGLVHVVPSRGAFVSQVAGKPNSKTVFPPIALRGSYLPSQDDTGGAYGKSLVHAIWKAANDRNAPVLLMPTHSEDNKLTRQYCQSLGARGVIFMGGETYHDACELRAAGLPVLLANRPSGATPLNYIDYDHEAALRDAIRRFVAAGHQRIAVLVKPTSTPGFSERLKPIFIEELCNHGIVLNFNDYWKHVEIHEEAEDPHRDCELALDAMLARDDAPTAIFSFSYAVLTAVRRAEATSGKSLSLISAGFHSDKKATVSGFVLQQELFGQELLEAIYQIIEEPLEFIQKLVPFRFVDKGTVNPPSF